MVKQNKQNKTSLNLEKEHISMPLRKYMYDKLKNYRMEWGEAGCL